MHTDRTNTIFIGDQLFTDSYGANRTGIRTILVDPIHPKEEIQIVLKRYLEKIVLHFYRNNRPETSNFGNKWKKSWKKVYGIILYTKAYHVNIKEEI